MQKESRCYLIWMLTFFASLTLLVGCVKKSNSSGESMTLSNEEVLKLNFVVGDVPSLNPHQLALFARGIALGKWLFEGLTRLNLEGEYELAGAENVEISPCQTRYTFTLRPNRYSDGTPIVADDYERSWKKALASDSQCLKAHLFYCIKYAEEARKGEVLLEEVGVKAVDDRTFVVELNHPTSHFLSLISSPLFAPFKLEGKEMSFSGPYRVDERKKDDYLTLEKNPFFWDCAHVAIKKVKIFMVKDGGAALSLYENKEIDWIGDPFSWLSSDIVASEVTKGTFFNETEVIYPFWIYLNTEHFPLSSPLIRQALSCVVDRKAIAEHIFVGDEPLFKPVPHNMMTGETLVDNDLKRGRELFEKGIKELGLTRETFPPLKLSSCSGMKKLVEYLQEKWQMAFGIQIDLEIQEWGTFYSDLANGKYQMGGYFISSDYNDPLACLELLASEVNVSRWHYPQYQQVIEKLKCEGAFKLRLKLLKRAEEILQEEVPMIWLVNRVQYHTYRSDLKGLCFDQRGIPDLRFAYFD